jgi:hypothetical protein
VSGIVPAGAAGTLYAIVPNSQAAGFVTKLSPDGTNIVSATLLRGRVSVGPIGTYAAEPPPVFATQNWID